MPPTKHALRKSGGYHNNVLWNAGQARYEHVAPTAAAEVIAPGSTAADITSSLLPSRPPAKD